MNTLVWPVNFPIEASKVVHGYKEKGTPVELQKHTPPEIELPDKIEQLLTVIDTSVLFNNNGTVIARFNIMDVVSVGDHYRVICTIVKFWEHDYTPENKIKIMRGMNIPSPENCELVIVDKYEGHDINNRINIAKQKKHWTSGALFEQLEEEARIAVESVVGYKIACKVRHVVGSKSRFVFVCENNWDPMQPNKPMDLSLLPCEFISVLQKLHNVEFIARQVEVIYGMPLYTRRLLWQKNPWLRQKMIEYAREHCLISWKNEPQVPWKGMKFFHGTSEWWQSPPADSTTESLALNPTMKCMLRPENSFTTPIFNKALVYMDERDGFLYTYRLLIDRPQMIDCRADFHADSISTARDPFWNFATLSGITHDGLLDRNGKASLMAKMFAGSDIDGAILNNQIEWIWFQPDRSLKWEYENGISKALSNVYQRDTEEFTANQHLEGHLYDLVHVTDPIQNSQRWIDFFRFIQTTSRVHQKVVSEVNFMKWFTRNREGLEYMNQYLSHPHSNPPPLWEQEALAPGQAVLPILEMDYEEFMDRLFPIYTGIMLDDSANEGEFNKDPLVRIMNPLNAFLSVFKWFKRWLKLYSVQDSESLWLQLKREDFMPFAELRIFLKLPSGRVQIIPPFTRADLSMFRRKRAAEEEAASSSNRQRTSGKGKVECIIS